MKKTLRAVALGAALAGLITGCGWQLRGHLALPEGTDSIFVSAEDSHGSLVGELKKLLSANQVTAAISSKEAQYSIFIEREDEKKRTVAVGSNTLAAEYELTLEVDYRIESADGEKLIPKATAQVARTYAYNRDDVVAKDEEEKLIKEEMRRNVVQQIIRRLRYAVSSSAASPVAADAATETNPQQTPAN